jgi:hypothetical protein
MRKLHIIHIIVLIFLIVNIINLKNLSLIDWDEGAFALQAQWLANMGGEGKPFNFQTPPLFQIIVAILFKIFGEWDRILPLISIVFSAMTLYTIFFLGRRLYDETVGLFAIILFVSTEYFFFFSKSGLSDAMFLFFFTTAIYLFYKSLDTGHIIHYLGCGFFALLACYTKYTGPILFLIFFIIGITRRKQLSNYWFLFTIAIPVLLLIPYFVIFVKIVTIQGISQRHGKLLGINHLKFLYYIFRFAPLVFLAGIFHRIREKTDYFVLIILVVFFVVLGFYYPYLRLAYPVIPFLSLFAAGFLSKYKKMRYSFLIVVFFFNVLIGHDTLIYSSRIPPEIGERVEEMCKTNKIKYIFALTPPNIVYYMDGKILQLETRIPLEFVNKKIGYLRIPETINEELNPLRSEKRIVFVCSTIFDDSTGTFNKIEKMAQLKDSVEFVDAPVYYKDLFNDLRAKRQIYKTYVVPTEKLDTLSLDGLWKIGFKRGVTVIKR